MTPEPTPTKPPHLIWKTLVAYPDYQINQLGKIRNASTKHVLIPSKAPRTGYLTIHLRREVPNQVLEPNQLPKREANTLFIHKLMAETWIGPPPTGPNGKPLVASLIDGNKENVALTNIQYLTLSEAIKGSFARGKRKVLKLTPEQKLEIINMVATGHYSRALIALKYEINESWLRRLMIKARKDGLL